jgi:uncharacterized protein (TIGR02466 family)
MSDPIIVGDADECADDSCNHQPNEQLETYHYFPTPVYKIDKPEFLNDVRAVMKQKVDAIKSVRKMDPIYPLYQTDTFLGIESIKPFIDYIGATAWNILDSQGYAMDNLTVFFQEIWGQEHHKHSAHEEHVHGFGCQLVGFYFLDTPKDCSRLVLHDPRPAKKLVNLPEKDMSQVTIGSTAINFNPKPGELYFVPSWVPHGFSRHSAKTPVRFIHFTIGVGSQPPTVEV